jgi:hypothetical protein
MRVDLEPTAVDHLATSALVDLLVTSYFYLTNGFAWPNIPQSKKVITIACRRKSSRGTCTTQISPPNMGSTDVVRFLRPAARALFEIAAIEYRHF